MADFFSIILTCLSVKADIKKTSYTENVIFNWEDTNMIFFFFDYILSFLNDLQYSQLVMIILSLTVRLKKRRIVRKERAVIQEF